MFDAGDEHEQPDWFDAARLILNVGGEWYTAAVRVNAVLGKGFDVGVWEGVPVELTDDTLLHGFRHDDRYVATGKALAWCYRRALLGPGAVS